MSESYVALAKVAKWFYSDILELGETEEYEEPEGQVNTWLVEDLKAWLRARGLSLNGNKQELVDKVTQSKSSPEGPPPLLKDIGLDEKGALRVVIALSAMLARVMVQTVLPGKSAKDLDLSIKVCILEN